jgi:hypothetical protein
MWPNLWCFLDSHAGGIQAAAAVVTFALTLVLVGATLWANHKTKEALRLTREQFEREWRPGVHVRVIDQRFTGLEFVNLGRTAIIVTRLFVKFPDHSPAEFSYVLDFVVPAGGRDSLNGEIQLYDAIKSSRQLPDSGSKIVPVDIGVRYVALDTPHQSRWFKFQLHVSRKAVTGATDMSLEPRPDADSREV